MNLSSPYIRTFAIGALFFAGVAYRMISRHEGGAFPPQHLIVLVVAWIVTALLLGVAATRFPRLRSWPALIGGTMMGAFLVMMMMLLVVKHLYGPPPPPTFENVGAMMDYYAKTSASWVKKDRGIELDYSFASIEVIEEELARIAKEVDPANPQPGTSGLAIGYGSYIGEVFRRQEGGSWATDHPQGGERSYPFTRTNNHVIFPVNWCWKRLTQGEEDNVYLKTMMFLDPQIDAEIQEAAPNP